MEMWETVLCLEGVALIFLVAGLVCLLVKGKRETGSGISFGHTQIFNSY